MWRAVLVSKPEDKYPYWGYAVRAELFPDAEEASSFNAHRAKVPSLDGLKSVERAARGHEPSWVLREAQDLANAYNRLEGLPSAPRRRSPSEESLIARLSRTSYDEATWESIFDNIALAKEEEMRAETEKQLLSLMEESEKYNKEMANV